MATAGSCADARFTAKPRTGIKSSAPAIVHLLAIGFLRCAPWGATSLGGLLSQFAQHAPITRAASPSKSLMLLPGPKFPTHSANRSATDSNLSPVGAIADATF